jgi:hypothetical protein
MRQEFVGQDPRGLDNILGAILFRKYPHNRFIAEIIQYGKGKGKGRIYWILQVNTLWS